MAEEPANSDRSAWQRDAPAAHSPLRTALVHAAIAGGAPVRRLMGVQILATGSYVPDQVVDNEELATLGFDAEWILQRTGIRERRILPPELATSDMALAAAQRCLARAEVAAADVDLLIVATFTPDVPVPSVACLVQHQLGISAPAMDLQAGCAGFVYALATAAQFVAAGTSRRALVIGADCNSRILNRQDMKIYPLFGDGAGAVLLGPGTSDQGLESYTLGADGSGAELLIRPMGGTRTAMTAEGLASQSAILANGWPGGLQMGDPHSRRNDSRRRRRRRPDDRRHRSGRAASGKHSHLGCRLPSSWASIGKKCSSTSIVTATLRPAASPWPWTRRLPPAAFTPAIGYWSADSVPV